MLKVKARKRVMEVVVIEEETAKAFSRKLITAMEQDKEYKLRIMFLFLVLSCVYGLGWGYLTIYYVGFVLDITCFIQKSCKLL